VETSSGAANRATHEVCIVAWNILHGGGGRRMPEIVLSLLDHKPDIVVLTEFRPTTGGQIAGVLADIGLRSQLTTELKPGVNGMCIASRLPVVRIDGLMPAHPNRWLGCHVPLLGLRIGGVHVPDASAGTARLEYWRDLLAVARAWCETPAGCHALFIGDLNSGRHGLDEEGRTFTLASRLGELATLGYRDVYRDLHPDSRDFSWFSRSGNGFRLDGAWASPKLASAVRSVEYSQIERETRVSDHAMLKIRVDFAGFLRDVDAGSPSRGTP
jgi:exodeoxyribonuclease-3